MTTPTTDYDEIRKQVLPPTTGHPSDRIPLENFPPCKNDLILRAARGEHTERVPVWMMRQAGRYLPEYRELRSDFSQFFEICRSPELAKAASLQPLDRFEKLSSGSIDAVIFFSDILVIPQAMGMEVLMVKGKGPVFPEPLALPSDLDKLEMNPHIEETLGYVFDGINLTRKEINGRVPLIGFSGGPWTLMAYMIEGGGSKTWAKCKGWLYNFPEASHRLLDGITKIIIKYLVGKVKAGAQLLQVFESWGGELAPHLFLEFSLPYLREIAKQVKLEVKASLDIDIPMTVFGRGLHYAPGMLSDSYYDVVGLDWCQDPCAAREMMSGVSDSGRNPMRKGALTSLQGNLDPCVLYGSKEVIEREVRLMLESFVHKDTGLLHSYIANLGHGMQPTHDPVHAGYFIEAVHNISEEIIKRKTAS